jgi:hypothetical protein
MENCRGKGIDYGRKTGKSYWRGFKSGNIENFGKIT